MFGGPNPSIASLGNIYTANNTAIALAMTRIATGKRISVPSDDFIGYAKASSLQTTITQYETIKQDINEAKGLADFAVQVGNAIVSDIDRLVELKTLYDEDIALNTDEGNVEANAHKAEYDAVWMAINDVADDSYYSGIKVFRAADLLTVKINPEGNSVVVNGTVIPDIDALSDIDAISVDDITDELSNAEIYTEHMKMFSSQMESWTKFADTVINSNEATISVITGIDEAYEMMTLTNLQMRQQATVAMMAQANIAQGYAAILYGGKQ